MRAYLAMASVDREAGDSLYKEHSELLVNGE